MFKGLRDRLKGVTEQLEDSLEAQLEAELEAELAKEMGEAAPEPTPEPAPTLEPAPTPEPEPAPESLPEAPEPTPEPVPEPEAPEKPTEPGQSTPTGAPANAATPTIDSVAPSEAEPAKPEPPAAPAKQESPSAPAKPAAPISEPAAPTHKPQRVAETAPVATAQSPQVESKKVKPAPTPHGRKMLDEDEISRRLEEEMRAAVDVQKDVEKTVQESGSRQTKYTINEEVLDDILWELEIGLLESDVALPVIEAIKANVKDQLLSLSVGGKSPQDVVEKVLRSAVRRVLAIRPLDFDAFLEERLKTKKPVVVMFVGVNGTGKTTSIARLAYRLQQQGRSCVLAAGDTFRAGAIEQLTQHGDKLGVKVIKHSAGADPAAVAYDAIEHAKARHKEVVLLDTAGRMQTNTNLMDEMDKIRRVADPDLVVFVGDSLAGNDAVEQARRFDEVVDIDGAILTKVDVDAKGGAALSVAYTINKPLLFVGLGQDYPDLKPFDPDWMVNRLFGDE